MSLLGLGYGLGGFMKGLNEEQNQQLLQQLSRLDLQRVQQQIRAQEQYDATAPLLFNYYLNQQQGGGQPGQPSAPQFGGGPFSGGTGAPTPPAAAQPSSPPQLGTGLNFTGSSGAFIGSPRVLDDSTSANAPPGQGDYYAPARDQNGGNGGPTFGGIGDYGGGDAPYAFLRDASPYSRFGSSQPLRLDAGGPFPSGPRISASRYGGMAVDPSFGPKLARGPVPQDPGNRFGPPGLGPLTPDAIQGPPKIPGGSGQYTFDSSGNLIDQVTGSPVSSVSSRAATPTTDIPPAATAPSSPPGFSGSSTAPDVIARRSPNLAGTDIGTTGYGSGATPDVGTIPASAGGDTTSVPGGFNAGYQALVNIGLKPEVARGITQYMAHNESGSNPLAVNPSSGALGRAQWLGSRKAQLESLYGRRPNDAQQATFMQQELLGPERATLEQLRNATTAKQGYDIWGRSFERPGAAALAKAGVGSGGGVPSGVASLGAGGGGANDAILQQAMGLIQKGLAPVPESMFGNMTAHQMAVQIEKANPNADPVVKMLALERGMKMMAPEERLKTEMYMQQHQDEFRLGLAVLQSKLTGERQVENQPWQVLTDPSTNQQFRYNPRTAQATTLTGEPYTPAGAQKIPGAGATGKTDTNVTVTDDQGKVVYDGAAQQKADGSFTKPDGTPLPKGQIRLTGKGGVTGKTDTNVQVVDDKGQVIYDGAAQQKPDGSYTKPDGSPLPAGQLKLMGKGSEGGGRIAEAQMTRMLGATTQVARALENVTKMPAGSTLGIFQGLQQERGDSLTEGLQRTLANAITPQTQQMMSAITRGISRSLATLESQGAAQGLVGLAQQMNAELPTAEDTGLTALTKLADIRQITEAAIETLNASPRMSPEQKALITKNFERITQAIPFTVADVIQLQANPDEQTYSEFAKSIGLGGGGGAGGQSGLPTITDQAGYNQLPSGAHYLGQDGQERVKP